MAEDERDELSHPRTIAALFEDTIDGGLALSAIRKAQHDPAAVSIVVRSGDLAGVGSPVNQAVVDADLGDLAAWLHGLASVVVPGQGSFLVAGPLGAVLAALGLPEAPETEAAAEEEPRLEPVLRAFGFGSDEASYLAHRLQAGAPLVAVTCEAGQSLQPLRRLLADHDAVFIGTAATAEETLGAARSLLEAPPEESVGSEVEVADVVGNLRHVTAEGGPPHLLALLGRGAVDSRGRGVGQVVDLLVEAPEADGPDSAAPQLRYVVLGFGGVLGFGRHLVAVPATLVDLTADPARLAVDEERIKAAPAFDDPFSRRIEEAVNAAFGLRPYWLEGSPA